MARRRFLTQLAGLPFLALGTKVEESKKSLKIMMKSAWGSDDPTRASFAFAHGLALANIGPLRYKDIDPSAADRKKLGIPAETGKDYRIGKLNFATNH